MTPRPRLQSLAPRALVALAWAVLLLIPAAARPAESDSSTAMDPGSLVRTRARKKSSTALPNAAAGETKKLSHPYLESWYDGRRNLPLATCAARTITEQDLYLFRLMRRDSAPELFQTWEKTRRASERKELTQDLEDALRGLAYMCTLSEAPAGRPPTESDERFIRFLKYPVYQLVWIEKVLRPSLRIESMDLVKYYHDNIAEFYKPEGVRVRYIFRAVPTGASSADRETLQKDTEAVRQQAVSGGNFVELARAKSDAPSALRGGELPVIHRGTLLEDFENHAFTLKPGEIGPVFAGPGGFYLIQCLEKYPEQQADFRDPKVQQKLRKAVDEKTLTYLYDYELGRILRRERWRSYAARFRDLEPDADLIIVGNYKLGKQPFLDMFPFVIREPLDFDARLVSGAAMDMVRGEMIAQVIERNGLANDPLLVAADGLARRIWRARLAVRKGLDVPLAFTDSELRVFHEQNRDLLGYQPQWRVLQISAAVRNPYLQHPSQLAALTAELKTSFQETLRDFRAAYREEQSRLSEERILSGEAPTSPVTAALLPEDPASTAAMRLRRMMMVLPRSVKVITDASTTDFSYSVRDLAFRNFRDKLIYDEIQPLREGQFSALEATSAGAVSCYFIQRYIPGAPVPYEKMPVQVRQQFILSRQAEALDALRAELERKTALRIQLPEIGSEEE